jgi:predicted MFS family arabinose efflux permease
VITRSGYRRIRFSPNPSRELRERLHAGRVSADAAAAPAPLRLLVRAPGFAWLLGSSLLGRAPTASLGLVFVLRTRELTGSLALAGAVSATYAIATGATMPLLGRIIDRRGQSPVLAWCAAIGAAALVVLARLPAGTGAAALLACALATGAGMPPLGSCLRALLPVMLGDPDRQHAALSLDSALVELTYVAGPALIGGALAAWSTSAAALASALLLVGGVTAFGLHPASRAAGPRPGARRGGLGALRARGVRALVAVLALVGVGFGAIEVGVPAATSAAGVPHAAGPLLALWGLGSLIGGLVAAHRPAPADGARRARWLLALLALLDLPLALSGAPVALGAFLLLAGTAIAPAFACLFALVEELAPTGTVTEAYGWLSTGITAGLAAGAAVAGLLAQDAGAAAALAIAVAASAAAATLAWARREALA